jgi:hypothetical protein
VNITTRRTVERYRNTGRKMGKIKQRQTVKYKTGYGCLLRLGFLKVRKSESYTYKYRVILYLYT